MIRLLELMGDDPSETLRVLHRHQQLIEIDTRNSGGYLVAPLW
jgi:hypothetical protein